MNIDSFVYLDRVRAIVLALPGTSEGICYGTPGFYVGKKLMARLKEDGVTLAVQTEERDKWMKAKPDIYYITDHYLNYSYMLVRLAKVPRKELETILLTTWKARATKTLLKAYEANKK